MGDETHVYNHYDDRPVEADFKIAQTTRGLTWEVELKYITEANFDQACQLYAAIDAIIKTEVPEEEES
jgi:hypothetical protein